MKRYAWTCAATAALTFPLIVLGAVVRLKGAGLACPDWPLCYGRVTPLNEVVSPTPEGIRIALEVGHRYLAGLVGLAVFGIAGYAWAKLERHPSIRWLSVAAVALLIPQALLGALTVWMKLAPITVSLHLISGNLFFGALILLTLQSFRVTRTHDSHEAPASEPSTESRRFRLGAMLALVAVALQIWLGGWVSSSGAQMVCPEFPSCHGEWAWPASYLQWLQMGHRAAGFVVAGVVAWLAVAAWRTEPLSRGIRALATALPVLVVAQIGLGWFNVAYYVPVPTAAMHTGLASVIFGVATLVVGHLWLPYPNDPHR